MKIRKLIPLVVAAGLLLTGCGSIIQDSSSDDPSKPIAIEDADDGVYILTKNNKLYRPNTENQSFEDMPSQADPKRVIYSTNGDKYVPTLYKDDRLVYFSKSNLPSSLGIERFTSAGYTIPVHNLSLGTNGFYSFTADDVFSDKSDMANQLDVSSSGNSDSSNASISIISLDGKDLPDKQVIEDAGILQGFDRNQKVTLGLMRGTHYATLKTKADTRAWYSVATSQITTYQATKNGYIILDLPDNITRGYISVNGTGLIRVLLDENREKE